MVVVDLVVEGGGVGGTREEVFVPVGGCVDVWGDFPAAVVRGCSEGSSGRILEVGSTGWGELVLGVDSADK